MAFCIGQRILQASPARLPTFLRRQQASTLHSGGSTLRETQGVRQAHGKFAKRADRRDTAWPTVRRPFRGALAQLAEIRHASGTPNSPRTQQNRIFRLMASQAHSSPSLEVTFPTSLSGALNFRIADDPSRIVASLGKRSGTFHGLEHACRSHGQLQHPRTHGVKDRVGDDGAHGDGSPVLRSPAAAPRGSRPGWSRSVAAMPGELLPIVRGYIGSRVTKSQFGTQTHRDQAHPKQLIVPACVVNRGGLCGGHMWARALLIVVCVIVSAVGIGWPALACVRIQRGRRNPGEPRI